MRLTKFNEETGKYELIKKAKTQEEFMAQRKAVIQRLGELEDMATRYMVYSDGRIERIPPAEGEWKDVQRPYKTSSGSKGTSPYRVCSACKWEYPVVTVGQHLKKYNYCPNCGARMKGADDEQR